MPCDPADVTNHMSAMLLLPDPLPASFCLAPSLCMLCERVTPMPAHNHDTTGKGQLEEKQEEDAKQEVEDAVRTQLLCANAGSFCIHSQACSS